MASYVILDGGSNNLKIVAALCEAVSFTYINFTYDNIKITTTSWHTFPKCSTLRHVLSISFQGREWPNSWFLHLVLR